MYYTQGRRKYNVKRTVCFAQSFVHVVIVWVVLKRTVRSFRSTLCMLMHSDCADPSTKIGYRMGMYWWYHYILCYCKSIHLFDEMKIDYNLKTNGNLHFGGLMGQRRNSITNALELSLYCTNPSISVVYSGRFQIVHWRLTSSGGVPLPAKAE